MTLNQIEYFLDVSKTLSTSQTAQNKFVSQPAVSKQISLLEQELDLSLFSRKKNQLELTNDGKVLRDCLLRCAKDFQDTRQMLQKSHRKSISLGYMASIDIGHFLLEQHNAISEASGYLIDIEGFNNDGTASTNYDIMITYQSMANIKHMKRIPLFDIQKYIAFSSKDSLAKKKDLCPLDFQDRTLFLGSSNRSSFFQQLAMCAKIGLRPKYSERRNVTSIILSVIADNGFCFIDNTCKEMGQPGLSYLPIDEYESIELLYREDAPEDVVSVARDLSVSLCQWFTKTYPFALEIQH